MRYVARSKLSTSLVHKKNLSLIWLAVFKLGYQFCNRDKIPLLSLNELEEKLQATIIFSKFDSSNKYDISNHLQWLRKFRFIFSHVSKNHFDRGFQCKSRRVTYGNILWILWVKKPY